MIIFLVRHTEYENPDNIYPFHLPVNLSTLGRENAKLIGKWFKKNNHSKLPIYSSPIARCIQTSEIIASETQSYISFDIRLIETYCPGLQGKTKPKKDAWKIENDELTRESKESILKRMLNILTEKINENHDCILVSHGDQTTMLYYLFRNKSFPTYFWDPENSDNIVNMGDIVKIKVEDNKVIDIAKINF